MPSGRAHAWSGSPGDPRGRAPARRCGFCAPAGGPLSPKTIGVALLLAGATHASSALAGDDPLVAYERQLEELAGQLDAASEGGGDEGARLAAIAALRQLDDALVAVEGTTDVRGLRARLWYRIGTDACEHGNALAGRVALGRSLGLDENPERASRIERRLSECTDPPGVPAPAANVPVAATPPPYSWRAEPDQEEPRRASRPLPPPRGSREPRGRGTAVGGVVLGLAGGAAVLGTWYAYQSTPEMSSGAWTGLVAGNTLGWVALGGGGVLIVTGAARGLSFEFGPFAVPAN